jgi:hypothetical protein
VEKKAPVDEDDGLKTLDDYAKERQAQAEALAKLVGSKQGRAEVDKKLDVCLCLWFCFVLYLVVGFYFVLFVFRFCS